MRADTMDVRTEGGKVGPAATSLTRHPWRWSNHAEILLVSFAALLIEIAYTRIVSYKLYYYYVFLIIGLALLGTGTGGVIVALSNRLRRAATDTVLFWSFAFGAVSTIVAYMIVAYVRINTLALWQYGTGASTRTFVMLLVICLCIFASFITPGVMIATLFGRRPKDAGGLYFADLIGAGIACAVVIYLVSALGAPATVMIAALALSVGAVWVAWRIRGWLAALACIVVSCAVVLATNPALLPSQQVDTSKAIGSPPTLVYDSWGPVFRVDLSVPVPVWTTPAPGGMFPADRFLFHDDIVGAGIYAWDGKRSSLAGYDFGKDPRSIPFAVLGSAPRNEAVIGAAGGHEVLTSLFYGAKHVDAVELNPVTVNLVENVEAKFDGHLAQNPAVHYIVGDGWSFMARHQGRFRLIWYPAPDSYSAQNAGVASANVSVESYLYTTNAMVSMLQHLTTNGLFVAQFGEVNDVYDLRTARFVATARQALAEMGVSNPKDHIMAAMTETKFLGSLPFSTIIVKRNPFTPQEKRGFLAGVQAVPQTLTLYTPDKVLRPNPVNRVVQVPNDRLAAFYNSFPYNITPTTDNDPYFYHFARFGTVFDNYTHPLLTNDRENQVAERVLLLLVGVCIVAAAILLLLPFVKVRRAWRGFPRKGRSALYFAGLGFGFIFFEITLMQDLNLFLGYPTYSLTITLMALLVFSGIGALLSARVRRRTRAIPRLFVVLGALTLFYLVGLIPLTDGLLTTPLFLRILVTLGVLAPLGLCLGMFMPIGVGEIAGLGRYPREYVAWAWAVNGFASVVGSALATILAMAFGFDFVLGLALAAYAVAVSSWLVLVPRRPSRRERHRVGEGVKRPMVSAGSSS